MAYPFPFVAGQVLTAAELNALESTSTELPLVAGYYYGTKFALTASFTMVLNRQYFLPLIVSNKTAVTATKINIATAATFLGTAVVRLGIYSDDIGQPLTKVLDAGTVSCTAANTTYEVTISQSLPAGLYWMSMCMQTAATTSAFAGVAASTNAPNPYMTAGTTASGAVGGMGWRQDSITGAFADVTKTNLVLLATSAARIAVFI